MIKVTAKWKDDNLARFGNALAVLGERQARVALARAANHETRKAYTQVTRALARQTSAPVYIIRSQVKTQLAAHKLSSRAADTAIEARIVATGNYLPLKVFKPRQFSYGTRAKVWGRFQTYKRSFMGPRPGIVAARLDGHVMHRIFRDRTPIEMSWGPALPKEMIIDESKAAFETAMRGLANRVGHEIARLLPK